MFDTCSAGEHRRELCYKPSSICRDFHSQTLVQVIRIVITFVEVWILCLMTVTSVLNVSVKAWQEDVSLNIVSKTLYNTTIDQTYKRTVSFTAHSRCSTSLSTSMKQTSLGRDWVQSDTSWMEKSIQFTSLFKWTFEIWIWKVLAYCAFSFANWAMFVTMTVIFN